MFGENKKLTNSNSVKDIKDVPAPYQATGFGSGSVISYTKTDKLITALYMVTDIIDKDEPLRNKLRTLGIEIVSDIHLIEQNNIGHLASAICSKISQIMSFLEIASTINIVSEMNSSILKKEFSELDQSIKESAGNDVISDRKINLSEFFNSPLEEYPDRRSGGGGNASTPSFDYKSHPSRGERTSKGHQQFTRIGVQKGSTLMKALSDKTSGMSNRVSSLSGVGHPTSADHFDILKKQRREDIINIIKTLGGGATIKDIKDKIKTAIGQASSLISCGEKTLQRELVSMVKNGVLNKTGKKRWSRYFLKN